MMNVGVIMSGLEQDKELRRMQFEKCMDLTIKHIKNNNEKVVMVKQIFGMGRFEIITDKSRYRTLYASENIRGHRWNKVLIFGDMPPKSIFDWINYSIRPIDFENREGWRAKDYIIKLD